MEQTYLEQQLKLFLPQIGMELKERIYADDLVKIRMERD